MARMSIDNLTANLTNPARSYLWEMIIPNPPGGGDSEALLLRCRSTVLPGASFETIHIDFKATAGFNIPGRLRYPQTIDLTFIEGEDNKVLDSIYAWRDLILDPETGEGSKDTSVKTDVYLTLLTTTGANYKKIKLIGAYPEAVADTPLNVEDSTVIQVTVTFRYDRWEKVE